MGNHPLFRTIAEVRPLLSREPIPLNPRHFSTAENQVPELVDHLVLMTRIVIGEVRLQFLEELPLAVFLLFETQAHK